MGQALQQAQRFVSDEIFGVVEDDAGGFQRQSLAALWVKGKQFTKMHGLQDGHVCLQRFPGGACRARGAR